MNNSFEKRILVKIKKEKIKPKSKWYFILKNSFYLSSFVIFLMLGSISFSIIFYIFSGNTSILIQNYNISELKNAVIFWSILLFVFLIFSILNNKKIFNSYKYSNFSILLFNISISFLIGYLLYFSGVARETDKMSSEYLHFYKKNIKITEIKKKNFY